MSEDILYVVEHIEAELQRLGRLVATLRRRVEAQQQSRAVGDSTTSTTTTTTVSGPVPHPTPLPASATRTLMRRSSRGLPAAIEEVTEEEAMVRTAGGGSSYGFVRDRRREEAPASEPNGMHDDSPLDRRTR